MKFVVLSILTIALLFEVASLAFWSPERTARDYDQIVDYVLSVQKDGFRQKDFEKFANDRLAMRKDATIGPAWVRMCTKGSLIALTISLGIVLLKWSSNKPNLTQEPFAPDSLDSP
jgi:hypothetical protein